MKHYWGMRALDEDIFVRRVKVIDTMDLSEEYVDFEDIAYIYSDKFINSYYARTDVSKVCIKNKHRKSNCPDRYIHDAFPDKKSNEGCNFEFAIKDGYVKYDGNDIVINFRGKETKVYILDTKYPSKYIIANDLIICRLALAQSKNVFNIDYISVFGDKMAIYFNLAGDFRALVQFTILLDYEVGELNMNSMSFVAGNTFPKTMDVYIEEKIMSVEDVLNHNIGIQELNDNDMLDLMEHIMQSSLSDKKKLAYLMDIYALGVKRGKVKYNNALRRLFMDYERITGFRTGFKDKACKNFSPDMYIKHLFLRGGIKQ